MPTYTINVTASGATTNGPGQTAMDGDKGPAMLYICTGGTGVGARTQWTNSSTTVCYYCPIPIGYTKTISLTVTATTVFASYVVVVPLCTPTAAITTGSKLPSATTSNWSITGITFQSECSNRKRLLTSNYTELIGTANTPAKVLALPTPNAGNETPYVVQGDAPATLTAIVHAPVSSLMALVPVENLYFKAKSTQITYGTGSYTVTTGATSYSYANALSNAIYVTNIQIIITNASGVETILYTMTGTNTWTANGSGSFTITRPASQVTNARKIKLSVTLRTDFAAEIEANVGTYNFTLHFVGGGTQETDTDEFDLGGNLTIGLISFNAKVW